MSILSFDAAASGRAVESRPSAVIILIHPDPNSAVNLNRDLGSDAFPLDRESLAEFVPYEALPAVREVLTTLRNQLGGESRVTAIRIGPATALAKPSRAASLCFPNLTIDRLGYDVRNEVGPISLTKSEFHLLVFLAENTGIVHTRRDLVRACHGDDYCVDDRSIDVLVFSLRRKLGTSGKYIQTVRGVGYRFTEQASEAPVEIRHPR